MTRGPVVDRDALDRTMRLATLASQSNVNAVLLSQIHDEIRDLTVRYQNEAPQSVAADMAALQEIVLGLLQGRQPPQHTRDLYLMAGLVTGMLAEACEDMGNLKSALMHIRTAVLCADNSGHQLVQVWARAQQALFLYWSGALRESLRSAQQATTIGEHLRGSTAVRLSAGLARTWAALGNDRAAQEAMTTAARLDGELVPDELDMIGGHLVFTRPRRLYWAADTSLLLNDQNVLAEREAAAAVEAYTTCSAEEYSFNNEFVSRADLALARSRLRDVEGAREAAVPVFAMPVLSRSHGLLTTMLRVHDALSTPSFAGSPDVADFQQQIEYFCGVGQRGLRPH